MNFSEEEPEEADARWTVRLTQRARADLDAQVAFLTQNVGDAQADAWEDGALETAGRLARFPTRHPLVPEGCPVPRGGASGPLPPPAQSGKLASAVCSSRRG